MKKVKRMEKILKDLAGGGVYLGYEYAACGIVLINEDKEYLIGVTKGLYSELAVQFQTSVKCIERDIRTLIQVIWRKGDKDGLDKIAGRKLKKRPTNKEFFDIMASYMKEEMEGE